MRQKRPSPNFHLEPQPGRRLLEEKLRMYAQGPAPAGRNTALDGALTPGAGSTAGGGGGSASATNSAPAGAQSPLTAPKANRGQQEAPGSNPNPPSNSNR